MTPERKTHTITQTIEYWSCQDSTHHHPRKEIAERCIAKSERAEKANNWTPSLYATMLSRRRTGESVASLATWLGVSKSRVYGALRTAEFRDRHAAAKRDGDKK